MSDHTDVQDNHMTNLDNAKKDMEKANKLHDETRMDFHQAESDMEKAQIRLNKAQKDVYDVRRDYGYVVRHEIVDLGVSGGGPINMDSAYNLEGHYIGSPEAAEVLCEKHGIRPELREDTNNVCSIGFCDKDTKWYGWSHRAMEGFGIGSKVSKGDCGYVPINLEDARQEAITFWSDDVHDNVIAEDTKDREGEFAFLVSWDLKLKEGGSKIGSSIHYPPKTYGQGAWEAHTLVDARKMASDFAQGVS